MKKFNFKWLLLSIILSIASINTAWAAYYVAGTLTAWSQGSDQIMTQVGSTNTYYKVVSNKASGTHNFRVTEGNWETTHGWSQAIAGSSDFTLSDYGNDNNINIKLTATSTLTVWFDSDDNKIWVTSGDYATQTIYVIGSNSWTDANVKAHVFTGVAAYYAWASDQTMTKTSTISRAGITYKVYSYTFPKGYKGAIFRYGTGDGDKTDDLVWSSSTPYYSVETSDWYATTADALAKYLVGTNWTSASWDHTAAANKMTDNGDGSYSKNISISDATKEIALKISAKGTWTPSWDKDDKGTGHNLSQALGGDDNLTFKVTHAGTTKITLTSSGKINVDAPYQVSYAAGTGATGTVSASTVTTYGSTCTLSSSTFSKTGYTQDGWATSNGGDKAYNLGGTYTGGYADATLYPHWTANNYDGTIDANGGAEDKSYTATYDATSLTITTAPTRTGYTLNGYYEEAECTHLIANTSKALQASTDYTTNGSKWNQTSAPDLFAGWTANRHSVTLDKGDGTTAGAATSVYDSTAIKITTTPSYSGYEVEGYYLSDGTTKVVNADGTLVKNVSGYTSNDATPVWIKDADCTIYTHWTAAAATYTLTFAVGSSPYNNGTVSATVAGNTASSGTAYNENSSIVITASPSSHYRVKGWYTDATCETEISGVGAPGTESSYTFTLTGNTTVYVAFELSQTAIQLYLNTGTSGSTDVTATHGYVLPSFTLAQKTGYTLLGYYTADSGGTKIINADGTLVASTAYTDASSHWNSDARNLDLYAQWSEDKGAISMSVNYDHGSSSYTASADNTIGVTTTSRIRCSKPNTDHYTFAGWTLTNLTVTSGNAATDSIIYVKKADPAGATPAAVANYNEVLTQDTWVLKGGTNITGDDWVTEHAMSKKSGASTSDVVYYTCNITSTNNVIDVGNNNFNFKIIKNGATDEDDIWYGLGEGSGQWWYYYNSGEQTLGTNNKDIQIRANAVGEYVIKLDYSTPASPKVTVEFPSQFIKGEWTSWAEQPFDKDGYYHATLAASTTYEFCVMYKSVAYKFDDKIITATTYDQTFNTSDNNCKITTTTAGEYVFGWNGATKQLSVIYPADDAKCKLIKDEYIYFDTRRLGTGSGWNNAEFSTRFWLKNYASAVDYGYVDCALVDTVEEGVYCFKVPAENLGQIQINRYKPDYSEHWCTANKIYTIDRGGVTTKNCLIEETDKEDWCDSWTPQWSATTYCPPMKTAVLADNGTSNHGGNGSKATPYLIEKGTTIYVTAASSTAFNDDAHMTHKYHFYDGATSKSDQTSATYSFTASSTVNTIHKVVVKPYNTYNSVNSRQTLKSDTVYYQVVQHYTVTYDGNGKTGGSVPTDATHYITGESATVLSNSGTLTKEGYTFDGWKDGSEVDHAVSSTITIGTSDVTLYAKWADDHNYYFSGATDDDWNTATNWTKGAVPNDIANTIYILQPVEIPAETTIKAAAVNIVTGGTYTRPDAQGTVDAAGHLSIEGGAGLIIAGALKRVADATALATKTNTREEDLHIGSTKANGNGVLIMGTHDGNNQAIVEFYTKSHGAKGSSASVNQFIGTPFSDCNDITYNYHNSWVYKVSYAGGIHWERVNGGEGLDEFKGYNIISADGEDHVYWMGGTLVESTNQSLSLEHNSSSTTENLLANSWMGPIVIGAFQAGDFTNCTQTIYIFNAGSPDDVDDLGEEAGIANADNGNSGAGQYTSIPINLSPFISGYKTIPSMQSFSIMASATSSAASLALNYNKLVYTPANTNGITYEKNHAPKRVEEEEEKPDFMKLIAVGESGYRDMVWMAVREDFTDGFEDGWEARKMYGEGTAPQMYAMSEAGEMAIDAVAELEGTVLAFHKGTEDNAYTFSFKYDGDGVWYLNDLQEQKSTRISEENNYVFTSAKGDNAARFVISKTPMSPTGIEGVGDGSVIRKLMIDGTLYIIRAGRMYNVEGALVK